MKYSEIHNQLFNNFDFEYSHEVPFPDNPLRIKDRVGQAFESVFDYASLQLA